MACHRWDFASQQHTIVWWKAKTVIHILRILWYVYIDRWQQAWKVDHREAFWHVYIYICIYIYLFIYLFLYLYAYTYIYTYDAFCNDVPHMLRTCFHTSHVKSCTCCPEATTGWELLVWPAEHWRPTRSSRLPGSFETVSGHCISRLFLGGNITYWGLNGVTLKITSKHV